MISRTISRFAIGGLAAAALLCVTSVPGALAAPPPHAQGKPQKPPLIIQEQGARTYGGEILGDFSTASLHCDHGFVWWQIPKNPRKIPLLMWHSSTQKTWETTFGNEEGFKNIFLRRGFPVYLVDAPRVGEAGGGCEEFTYTPNIGNDQSRVNSFRLGIWIPPAPPEFYPGVQFPVDDQAALAELFRASVPEFNTPENVQLQADAAAQLLQDIGPTTLITHSGSGSRGWWTRLKSDNVKGIVSYEPSSLVWPEGEVPDPILRADGALVAADEGLSSVVPLEEFMKLTTIPIQIVLGDNIPLELDPINVGPRLTLDTRRIRLMQAKQFAEAINNHGGNAVVVHLPEHGIFGNTHFPMSDLNNDVIADLLSQFLKDNGLDKGRGGKHADDDHKGRHDRKHAER